MRTAAAGKLMIRLFRTLQPATLGLILAAGVWVGTASENTDGRVVAVGDIHGDLESFVAVLREAGLIDQDRRWTGGQTILVQTGDFLDRGPQDIEVMDLLRTLQSQASKSGGRVIVLLGNHEILNLQSDFRYVSVQSWAAFADEKSERRRQDAYRDYVRYLKKRAKLREAPEPVIDEAHRESWMALHPIGYLERIKALRGEYGKWLRGLPAVIKVDDTIFLHAGLHPDLAALSLDEINRRVKNELESFDDALEILDRRGVILRFFSLPEIDAAVGQELSRVRLKLPPADAAPRSAAMSRLSEYAKFLEALLTRNWMVSHPDGPVWFRGYAEWGAEEEASLEDLLETYRAKRFVVGHSTVLPGAIQDRFGGKIFLIDTGMLSDFYPGGRASALEIRSGRVRPIYLKPSEANSPTRRPPR